MLVVALVSSVLTLGAVDYLTMRVQLKLAQRHLAEWQKSKRGDGRGDETIRLKKRPVPVHREPPVQR